MPDGLSQTARIAATFVSTANSPDSRTDHTPGDAWRRAAPLATPKLAARLATPHRGSGGGMSWSTLAAHDGWVSVSIINVDGDGDQDAAPTATASRSADGVYAVTFQLVNHTGDSSTTDPITHEWDVTMTHGRVSDFTEELQ
jgi:hypothetical protein